MFRNIEVLFTTGTTEQILGEMAEMVGENADLPFEALVAARGLKKSMLAAAAAEETMEASVRVPVEVSIGVAGERLPVDPGLRSSEPGVSHAGRAQMDVGTGLVGRAASSPAVNQQHDRSALTRESGASGVMTCRS
jgi:hypothetical protein